MTKIPTWVAESAMSPWPDVRGQVEGRVSLCDGEKSSFRQSDTQMWVQHAWGSEVM